MKIYWYKSLEKGWNFDIYPYDPDREDPYSFTRELGLKRFNGNWPQIKFRARKSKKYNDFADIAHCYGPIVRKRILDLLPQYFCEECEPIPFKLKKETFYLLNVPFLQGAVLQTQEYKVQSSEEAQKIFGYSTDINFPWYVLDKDKIKGHNIFNLYQTGFQVVSDSFKRDFEASGLDCGLFQEVWDSEEDDKPDIIRLRQHIENDIILPRYKMAASEKNVDCSKMSYADLHENIISESIVQVSDFLKNCETPATMQLMWFFDGQHIELACYIVSNDSENELILTNESKSIDSMLYALLDAYKSEKNETVDIKDTGVFDNEVKKICVKIGNHFENELRKLNITIIEPDEHD